MKLSRCVNSKVGYYMVVALIGLAAGVLVSGLEIFYTYLTSLLTMVRSAIPFILITGAVFFISYTLVRGLTTDKRTGSGAHSFLNSLHFKGGYFTLRDTIVKPLASVLTIAAGGSAGLEGPSIVAGSGIASIISRKLGFNKRQMRILYLAGAAAGLSAIFKAPFTGILFVLEMPYKFDIEKDAFFEATTASLIAYLVSILLTGSKDIFGIAVYTTFNIDILPYLLLFGVVAGAYSMLFVRSFQVLSKASRALSFKKRVRYLVPIIGLSLGAMYYFFPLTTGLGYAIIPFLITGSTITISTLLILLVLKAITTDLTLTMGGSGGLLIPSLLDGAILGALFSRLMLGHITPLFVAVGMAAVLAGTHKMILTPTAFIAEVIGPLAVIPSLIVTAVSYASSFNVSFYPAQLRNREAYNSLDTVVLYDAMKNKERASMITVNDIMTPVEFYLMDSETVMEGRKKFDRSNTRALPLLNPKGKFEGMIEERELEGKKAGIKMGALATRDLYLMSGSSIRDLIETYRKDGEEALAIVDKDFALLGLVYPENIKELIIKMSG